MTMSNIRQFIMALNAVQPTPVNIVGNLVSMIVTSSSIGVNMKYVKDPPIIMATNTMKSV